MSREAEIYIGAPPPRLRPLRPGETPAELAIAIGLARCPECHEFRGMCATEDGEVRLLCICEGILCRRCGRRNIRRPISDHFNDSDGRIWHTPYFMGFFPCADCRAEVERLKPTCPRCGSRERVPIVYGLPGPGLEGRAARREVSLGGCVTYGNDPKWACANCDEPL